MSKRKLKWVDRDLKWFVWVVLFGAFPFLASLLIELNRQDFSCCAFIKPSDVASSGLALFVTNFNLVGVVRRRNSEKRLTLILLSVAGIFLMGVCAAVIGSNIETGAYFNAALYVIVGGSIVLSYLSNRYLFVYTKLKKL